MPTQIRLRAMRPISYPYNTRRLQAGDEFRAPRRDARVLIATRQAREVREPVNLAPPPPALAAQIAARFGADPPAGDLAAARADYRAALGKPPWHGWDAATLRGKIAAAKPAA